MSDVIMDMMSGRLLDLIAIWQILVIAYLILWDGHPVDRAGAVVVEEPGGDGRGNNASSDAKGQAGIQVITFLVNVGVVLHKDGGVQRVLSLNSRASIRVSNIVNFGTIFSGRAKADCLANLKVATHRVNNVAIDCGELVSGNSFGP
jgi:hypothetical protein